MASSAELSERLTTFIMELSTQVLIALLATFVTLRWIVLGFVISKHGTPTKPNNYNAYRHVSYTLLLCWVLFELYN